MSTPISFDPGGLLDAVQMGVIPAGSTLTLPGERMDQLADHLATFARSPVTYPQKHTIELYGTYGVVTVKRDKG